MLCSIILGCARLFPFQVLHTLRDQTIDLQFGASRDGESWWRVGDRRSAIPMQPAGDWGSGQQWPFRSLVADAEDPSTLHLYYSGCLGPHGDLLVVIW